MNRRDEIGPLSYDRGIGRTTWESRREIWRYSRKYPKNRVEILSSFKYRHPIHVLLNTPLTQGRDGETRLKDPMDKTGD